MIKKLALIILSSLIFINSLALPIEASAAPAVSAPQTTTTTTASPPSSPAPEGTWYNQNFFDWYGKVYDTNTASEIFGERYTAAQVQWVVYGLVSFIFNLTGSQDIFSCAIKGAGDLSACSAAVKKVFTPSQNQTPNITFQNKSLLSLVFADRPLSGIGYVKKLVQKFNLVPAAYAAPSAGFGFDALKPIQEMWTGTRNVAFGLFVIVAIVFAFMIMFRVKISPQVVITVQSAIPKIIMALILVTFSYAIAGLLIDLMYVVIGLLSLILVSFGGGIGNATGVFNFLTLGQPAGGVQVGALGFLTVLALPLLTGLFILTLIVFLIGGATFAIGGFAFWILMIPLIIAIVVILWICIKTIWGLFKAFAMVVLLTIFAPLQILLGVLIPNFGFGQWVKSYISQLSIFVVTGVMGYLSIIFTVQGIIIGLKNVNGGDTVSTEILKIITTTLSGGTFPSWAINSSPWPPLLGSGSGAWTGILFLGVSFVLFTMIPKAAEVVQAFLSGKPFAYGSAIGEAFGPVKMAGSAGLGYGFGKYEEGRAKAAAVAKVTYEPAAITQALRTLGIIRK